MRVLLLVLIGCSTTAASPPAPAPAHPQRDAPAPATATPTTPGTQTPAPSVPAAPQPGQAMDAVAVIQAYYEDLDAKMYPKAFHLWEGDGSASGQTLKQFTAGFAQTAHTRVAVGTPGPVQGAAGSTYVTIPVDVYATLKDKTEQHFTGTYDLRKSNIPTAGQSAPTWELHSASLKAAAK